MWLCCNMQLTVCISTCMTYSKFQDGKHVFHVICVAVIPYTDMAYRKRQSYNICNDREQAKMGGGGQSYKGDVSFTAYR